MNMSHYSRKSLSFSLPSKIGSALLLPFVAILGGCGGSDESAVPIPDTNLSAVSGALDSVKGNILSINGRNLDASAARFEGTSLSTLKPGMVLDIKLEKGLATSVLFDADLQAPISHIEGDIITMAGVRVLTKDARFDDGLTFTSLKVGDMLEVSGFYLDGEQLKASFIERSDYSHSELEGLVTALTASTKQFKLGKVTVDYSGTNINIDNGDLVEVAGQLDGLLLKASSIEHKTPDYQERDEIETEGLISWVSKDGTHLVLDRHTSVAVSDQTRFEEGSAADLKPGRQIEVEGIWDMAAMRLVAKEIEFDDKDDNGLELEGREFEAPGFATLYSNGQISLNGINFTLSSGAEFDELLPSDINGSNWVSLSGYEQAGEFIVTELEAEQLSSRIKLEGKVQSIADKAGMFGYQTVDGTLNGFIGQHGEFKCTLGAEQQISDCAADND